MENRKKLFWIGPDACELKTGRGGERAKAFNGVLVGKFGDDFLSGSEIKFAFAEVNGLRPFADQVHFDAMRFLIIDGAMSPFGEVEVCAQFTIGARREC